MKPRACVILPTYNEAENVGALIPRIFAQADEIPTHDLHVLVVDDNSPDGTQQAVQTLMAKHRNLHLLTGPKRGLGEAYKRGMNYAMGEMAADLVFEMDADGQHDPGLIPVFAYLAAHDISLIIGSRFAPGGRDPGVRPAAAGAEPGRELDAPRPGRPARHSRLHLRVPVHPDRRPAPM